MALKENNDIFLHDEVLFVICKGGENGTMATCIVCGRDSAALLLIIDAALPVSQDCKLYILGEHGALLGCDA
jgi:hypothetical protein